MQFKVSAVAAFVASALTGGMAFAGGPLATAQEAPVYAPAAAPVSTGSDWTGGYVGLGLSNHNAEVSFGGLSASDSDTGLGVFAGYNHDFGQYVVGGELSFDRASDSGVDLDLTRLKGRIGYDAGQWMPYAMLGFARLDATDGFDSYGKSGVTFGLGADFAVTNNFVLGLELSRSAFSDFIVEGIDADIDTLQIRGSWKF